MSKYPAKRKAGVARERNAIVPAGRNELVPRQRDADVVEVFPSAPRSGFNFRYSFTEVSAVGGAARVKAKQARYEDGKLTTETFEGNVDRGVYDRMIDDAQRLFLRQTTMFERMLAAFLPMLPGRGRDRD